MNTTHEKHEGECGYHCRTDKPSQHTACWACKGNPGHAHDCLCDCHPKSQHTPTLSKGCEGLSCYDAREKIYDPKCACCCHRAVNKHEELLRTLKVVRDLFKDGSPTQEMIDEVIAEAQGR